jgi:hypothetical protein
VSRSTRVSQSLSALEPGWWPHMWPWVGITRQLMFMELCTCRVYSNQCLTSRITNRAWLD